MLIDRRLARFVIGSAIDEPFRQTDVLPTRDFTSWLEARGISLTERSLVALWRAGLARPIGALEPAVRFARQPSRFVPTRVRYPVQLFTDLGRRHSSEARPPNKLPATAVGGLLWHPFQLWWFSQVFDALEFNVSRDAVLLDSAWYGRMALTHGNQLMGGLRAMEAREHVSFTKILGLMLYAEPLVHLSLSTEVRLPGWNQTSLNDYTNWVHTVRRDAAGALNRLSLSTATVKEWHERLCLAAAFEDPVQRLRMLLRHGNEQAANQTGLALKAQDFLRQAEVLRRYLHAFHGEVLPEEDEVRNSVDAPAFKKRFFGSENTTDFDRAVFRRIVRHYGLDPQPRTTWFVEGPSEEAFICRLAERRLLNLDRLGVELMQLEGVGGLHGRRLMSLMQRHFREEAFAYVTVDRDNRGDHIRQLLTFRDRGLLPAGFRVFTPDFEAENFTLGELAGVGRNYAARLGNRISISASDVTKCMSERNLGAGDAVIRLLNGAHLQAKKGTDWGSLLADWAYTHRCPASVSAHHRRPIETCFSHALRGQTSNFRFTVERMSVNDEGVLVEGGETQDG